MFLLTVSQNASTDIGEKLAAAYHAAESALA